MININRQLSLLIHIKKPFRTIYFSNPGNIIWSPIPICKNFKELLVLVFFVCSKRATVQDCLIHPWIQVSAQCTINLMIKCVWGWVRTCVCVYIIISVYVCVCACMHIGYGSMVHLQHTACFAYFQFILHNKTKQI